MGAASAADAGWLAAEEGAWEAYLAVYGASTGEGGLNTSGGTATPSAVKQAGSESGTPPTGHVPRWRGTLSVGGNADLHAGLVHLSGGTDLNVGFWYLIPMEFSWTLTAGGGPGLGAGAGCGVHATITNAISVDQLNGPGTNYGLNCGVGGVGWVTGHNGSFNPVYNGMEFSTGPMLPTFGGGIYADNTVTDTILSGLLPWNPDAEWWFGLSNPFGR